MATNVPNTNTFKMTDVTAVVGGNSLSAAFANSVDSYFDPLYKGSKNSLYNFRNYAVPVPAFVGIYSTTILGVNTNGTTWGPGSYTTPMTDPNLVAYDPYYKILVYGRSDGNLIQVVDVASNPMRVKTLSTGLNGIGWVNFTNGYWYVCDSNSKNVKYRYRTSYDSFTSITGNPQGSTVGTTGNIRDIRYSSDLTGLTSRYFYVTSDGEMGYFTTNGGTWTQLHDSDTIDFKYINAASNKIIGIENGSEGRAILTTDLSNISEFDLDNANNYSVKDLLQYSSYSLVLTSVGYMYYVIHSLTTPVGVPMHPTGDIVASMAVDGTDIYATINTGGSSVYIGKKTSPTSSWTTFIPNIGFNNMFKY